MKKIVIKSGIVQLSAELYDTPTSEAIANLLPLTGYVNTWGEEIFFSISLELKLEPSARQELEIGELGYWPVGPAFCIFFGKTPVSNTNKPRSYSKVNVFGKMIDPVGELKKIKDGDLIHVEISE